MTLCTRTTASGRSRSSGILPALLLAGCTAGAATPPFDPAARSTALPGAEREALVASMAHALPELAGPEASVVGIVDRDGERFLASLSAPMPEHGHVHFWMAVADRSSGAVELAIPVRADAAAFAGPGRIAYVDHAGELRVGALGEQGRVVHAGCDPDLAVAADGRTALVAVREPDASLVTDLAAVDLETGGARIVASGPGPQSRAVIAPDGRRVVYVDGAIGLPQLRVVDLETGEDRALSNPAPRKGAGPPKGFVPPPARREGISWVSATRVTWDAGGGERWSIDIESGDARREAGEEVLP